MQSSIGNCVVLKQFGKSMPKWVSQKYFFKLYESERQVQFEHLLKTYESMLLPNCTLETILIHIYYVTEKKKPLK